MTLRDVTDFRNWLHREQRQAVASVNRALVTIRRFFDWLVRNGSAESNPAKMVKELRRQPLAPKGLEGTVIRRLLREIELRQDVRAGAIFSLLLYTGCRVSDLVKLELNDVILQRTDWLCRFSPRQRKQTTDGTTAATSPAGIAELSGNSSRS